MNQYYQQGDCLIKRINNIPKEAVKQKTSVLVEGEHTGHAHRIGNAKTAVLFVVGMAVYLRAFKDTPIEHEEHNTIILPPGDYQIDRVKEYDHFEEEAGYVAD